MDQRNILVVESDNQFANQIKDTLERYGVPVHIVGDGGEGLQHAKSNPPELIILCVELPNMSGYSICNKLKKNPDLKQIPLIIMSKDATPTIFEQHKKLKTRAEDYLIKPFEMNELIQKISRLIGLGPPLPGGIASQTTTEYQEDQVEEFDVALSDPDDPVLEDEIEISDEFITNDQPTQMMDVDPAIALATEAAFAALEIQEEGPDKVDEPMEILLPSEAATTEGMETEGEPLSAPPVETLEMGPESGSAIETSAVVDEPSRNEFLTRSLDEAPEVMSDLPPAPVDEQYGDLPQPEMPPMMNEEREMLEEVHEMNEVIEPTEPGSPLPEKKAFVEHLRQLEDDNRRLGEELDSFKTRSEHVSSHSRDRELLSLREVINKKEKEILDLRDDVDSKERQILDHKDKVRELERKVRDMDEKLLGIEREMITSKEHLEALQQDKEQVLQRESSLKARLAEAKEEINKAYAENDALKERHAQELKDKENEISSIQDQHLGELNRRLVDHEEAIEKLHGEHQQALDEAAVEKQAALDEAETDKQAALDKAEADKQNALQQADEAHEKNLQTLREEHESNQQELEAKHNEQQNQLRAEREEQVQQERAWAQEQHEQLEQQHREVLRELEEQYQQKEAQLRSEHAEEMASLKEHHGQQMEQKDAAHAGEKEALRTEHRAEMENKQQELDEKISSMELNHRDQAAGMENRHKSKMDEIATQRKQEKEQLDATIARLEEQITALEGDLSDTERKLTISTENEQQLATELQESKNEITEHKHQIESLQGQLVKAHDKIRNDEALAEKATRAMAIAITLLEEQKKLSIETDSVQDSESTQDQPSQDL